MEMTATYQVSLSERAALSVKIFLLYFFEKILKKKVRSIGAQFLKKLSFRQLIFICKNFTRMSVREAALKQALKLARKDGDFSSWYVIYNMDKDDPLSKKELVDNMHRKAKSFSEWKKLHDIVKDEKDLNFRCIKESCISNMCHEALFFWQLIKLLELLEENDPRTEALLERIRESLNPLIKNKELHGSVL